MKDRSSARLGFLLFVAFLAAGWWFLAPPALGGKTSYAVTSGISMEPHFHAGDLVLLRQQDSYNVGEIVGYHSHELHRQVMHRIVRISGGHYFFKGDNNSYVDPEHPVASQLFGREWLRLPQVGAWLETLHEPRNAALLSGLAALLVLLGGGATTRRRRRRPRPVPAVPAHAAMALKPPAASGAAPAAADAAAAAPAPTASAPGPAATAPRSAPTNLPQIAIGLAAVGLAAVAAFSVLGAMAYSHPPVKVVTQTNLWTERGQFQYFAPVPVGAVYDHTPLRTGDAVFYKLVNGFTIGFNYSITSKEAGSFSGQGQMDAILSDGAGWTRTIHLAPPRTFAGNALALQGYLDLTTLRRLIARFEATTGATTSQYHLSFKPSIRVNGAIQGNFIHEQFTPSLDMDMTNDRLRISQAPGAPTGFVRTKSGTGSTKAPRQLGGLSMGVSQARSVARIGIPIAVLLALLGGALFMMARSNDEVGEIRRRYGPWMIEVAAADRPPSLERRVESMDALARIAERYERLILHEQRDRVHTYLVEDDGIVYRYDAYERQAWRGGSPPAAPQEEQPVAAAPREPGGDGTQ